MFVFNVFQSVVASEVTAFDTAGNITLNKANLLTRPPKEFPAPLLLFFALFNPNVNKANFPVAPTTSFPKPVNPLFNLLTPLYAKFKPLLRSGTELIKSDVHRFTSCLMDNNFDFIASSFPTFADGILCSVCTGSNFSCNPPTDCSNATFFTLFEEISL